MLEKPKEGRGANVLPQLFFPIAVIREVIVNFIDTVGGEPHVPRIPPVKPPLIHAVERELGTVWYHSVFPVFNPHIFPSINLLGVAIFLLITHFENDRRRYYLNSISRFQFILTNTNVCARTKQIFFITFGHTNNVVEIARDGRRRSTIKRLLWNFIRVQIVMLLLILLVRLYDRNNHRIRLHILCVLNNVNYTLSLVNEYRLTLDGFKIE